MERAPGRGRPPRPGYCARLIPAYDETVIYCVIPPELEAELYDKLVAYYADNPGVTVIVDRRRGPDRRQRGGSASEFEQKRELRDRRRPRIPGTFADTEPPAA